MYLEQTLSFWLAIVANIDPHSMRCIHCNIYIYIYAYTRLFKFLRLQAYLFLVFFGPIQLFQLFGFPTPWSREIVERANGGLKSKIAHICADSVWPVVVQLAQMHMSQVNCMTHFTPHKMLSGRPMPVPFLRGPYKDPPLKQLEKELEAYCKHLTKIHKVIFQ